RLTKQMHRAPRCRFGFILIATGAASVICDVRPRMRIYITDAQVPELASFPPVARRSLRRLAFQKMFAAHPRLRGVPAGLCVFGALIGLFTYSALPRSLYSWGGDDFTPMFV